MRSPREAGLSLIEMVGERDGLIGSAGSPQRARAPARAEASVGGLYNRHAELRSLPAKPLNRQGWPIRCLDRGEPIAVTGIDAIMNRRSSKPNLTARLVGHIFGVLGAMMGIEFDRDLGQSAVYAPVSLPGQRHPADLGRAHQHRPHCVGAMARPRARGALPRQDRSAGTALSRFCLAAPSPPAVPANTIGASRARARRYRRG